jgi:hypothetical protein
VHPERSQHSAAVGVRSSGRLSVFNREANEWAKSGLLLSQPRFEACTFIIRSWSDRQEIEKSKSDLLITLPVETRR